MKYLAIFHNAKFHDYPKIYKFTALLDTFVAILPARKPTKSNIFITINMLHEVGRTQNKNKNMQNKQ